MSPGGDAATGGTSGRQKIHNRAPPSAHHPHKSHNEHRQCNPGGGVHFAVLLGSDNSYTTPSKIPLWDRISFVVVVYGWWYKATGLLPKKRLNYYQKRPKTRKWFCDPGSPPTPQDPPENFKDTRKWLKSDFRGFPQSDSKVTPEVTFWHRIKSHSEPKCTFGVTFKSLWKLLDHKNCYQKVAIKKVSDLLPFAYSLLRHVEKKRHDKLRILQDLLTHCGIFTTIFGAFFPWIETFTWQSPSTRVSTPLGPTSPKKVPKIPRTLISTHLWLFIGSLGLFWHFFARSPGGPLWDFWGISPFPRMNFRNSLDRPFLGTTIFFNRKPWISRNLPAFPWRGFLGSPNPYSGEIKLICWAAVSHKTMYQMLFRNPRP